MAAARMVVTDGFTLNPGDNPRDELETLGTLTVYARTAPAELKARCGEAEILIVKTSQFSNTYFASSVRSVAGGGAGASADRRA
ncbi:MAG: hypothetical protein HY895_14605 [Deltaproteobacteria bacterium]|nr:hypothetical protein [Deltaproteobacteria bacterium]